MAAANLERVLQKNHMVLMRHPETGFYSGVILIGESAIKEDVPTACTDGRNKYYGRAFMESLDNEAQVRFVQLHETKHVADKHLTRFQDLIKEDKSVAFAAMDYQINDDIMSLKDKSLCEMPKGDNQGLYEPQFHNWSVRQIYRFLRTGNPPPPQPGGQPPPKRDPGKEPGTQGGPPKREGDKVTIDGKEYKLAGHDDHLEALLEKLTPEERKKFEKEIDQAIQQGALLAGLKNLPVPRGMVEAIEPEVDWRAEMADFLSSHIKGRDEYTWRKLDKRRLPDDIYLPDTYSEKINELAVACDLSGSIGPVQYAEWFGALYAAVQSVRPDKLHILWWDTRVNSCQTFEDGSYEGLLAMLKPVGGGGTAVGCVSEYMAKHNIKPDCLLVFTDGYVEPNPKWDIDTPTLWLVTECENFEPPKGQRVKVKLNRE